MTKKKETESKNTPVVKTAETYRFWRLRHWRLDLECVVPCSKTKENE